MIQIFNTVFTVLPTGKDYKLSMVSLRMTPDNNAHDFEVQHEKSDNLPGEEFAPESG
jgi:hypothetical protein